MLHLAWELVILQSQALFHALTVLGTVSFDSRLHCGGTTGPGLRHVDQGGKGKMGGRKDLDAQR